MKTRFWFILLWMLPLVVQANPCLIDGESLLAFGIVAFWALVVESGIATLSLFTTGVLLVPTFGMLLGANVAVFLFAFLPLTDHAPLLLLEVGVVLTDALAIKLLTSIAILQGDSFSGVSWRRVLVASLLGNASSYFIGVIASHSPWLVHTVEAAEY